MDFLAKKEKWFLLAFLLVAAWQYLIIANWQQAKMATFLNVIFAAVLVMYYGRMRTAGMIKRALKSFQSMTQNDPQPVLTDIEPALPAVVRKWLNRSQIARKHLIQRAHLTYEGKLKTTTKGPWWPVKAEQWFTTDPPGFIWKAQVGSWWSRFVGLDRYFLGRGYMLIKLFSLIPVVDKKGKAIDQGAMVRYLAEIIWFPAAILSKHIRWQQVNDSKAKAIMNYGKLEISGVFEFNEAGDVTSFEALRYYDRKEGATLETWHVDIDETSYRNFQGIRIPAKSSVTWKLKEGDFTWYQVEVVKAVYNERL